MPKKQTIQVKNWTEKEKQREEKLREHCQQQEAGQGHMKPTYKSLLSSGQWLVAERGGQLCQNYYYYYYCYY